MKKEKGFTLIELLAVIVILAIITLIAVPQVLKILTKARLSAAEDSVYGIVKASESYVTNFMLKNNGSLPNKDLVFNCSSNGCELTTELTGYELTNLDVLDFKGTTPSSGTITITNGGKDITTDNLKINGFSCTYENEKTSCSKSGTDTVIKETLPNKTYVSGEAVTIGGYNWHVIGDDGSNVTLLMDAGQISDMKHCTEDTDPLTDCGVDSTGTYYVYSWDKSLIRNYLNETLYPELSAKISNMVSTEICADSSNVSEATTYGGYLKNEIENISGAICTEEYVSDYVRLISYSEYWNLSPKYSDTNANYPNIANIDRLDETSNYADWLYSSSIGYWWTMNAYSGSDVSEIRTAVAINTGEYLFSTRSGGKILGVRPVITISK